MNGLKKAIRNTLTIAAMLLALTTEQATAQLRVVTYNTLDKPSDSIDRSQLRTIFDAIASTTRNGIAKRPDIVALQEQATLPGADSTGNQIAAELNDLYEVDTYQFLRVGSGFDLLMYVFDSSTVTLEASRQVFTIGAPRPALRTQFRPVGYDNSSADLYLYNAHLKAGSSNSDKTLRANEATSIRGNADALGANANIIYLGDFNIGSSGEQAYTNFRAAGSAQAVDPINLSSWSNFLSAEHHTQSTRTSFLPDEGATGGMDDRFDIQLVTDELLNGEGLSYLGPTSAGFTGSEHSYQAFGNDGVSYNQRINNTFTGRSQPAAVLNALHDFSDHLPVVADYQLPAVMEVVTGVLPETLNLGETFSLDVAVRNAADVLAAIGADELDYVLSTTGDVSGDFSGSELALAAGAMLSVAFDTTTLGLKTGTIEVSTSSLAAQNSLVQIPISYEVVAAGLAGDFNDDGVVDAVDYAVWREGLPGGEFTSADFDLWRDNYGATNPGGAGSGASVPEPAAILLLMAIMLAATVKRRC